jgi:hypothetical protein
MVRLVVVKYIHLRTVTPWDPSLLFLLVTNSGSE